MGNTQRRAEQAMDTAREHPAARALVTVGLIAFGIVHLVLGWITLQVAWGGAGGEQADQQGALQQLASTPIGTPLLWVLGIGLLALALWQLGQAISEYTHITDSGKRLRKRVSSGGRTVIYAALGVAALQFALGSGSSGSSNQKKEGMTASLLAAPLGRILVIVVGLVVIGVGVGIAIRGITKKFTEDLTGGVPPSVIRLGQVGYVAKGAAIAVVGGLFGWAALSYDPSKAGGMDNALKTIASAPLGPYLLTLMALGFAAFGVYCFFWSRRARV